MARLSFLNVIVIFQVFNVALQQNVENFASQNDDISRTTAGPDKPRTLYDYQTRVVAYKDLIKSRCLLEIINGGESHVSSWLTNGSRDSTSKNFLISRQFLSKRQIWRIAGQRITEFCRGFPTFLIKDVASGNQNTDDDSVNELSMVEGFLKVRRKRSTRHYFQGRLRGQTQSQYLNFGNTGQPGKAEAESTPEGSKAVVSGSNGIGQAQSQSHSLGCEECYGQVPGAPGGYDQQQVIDFSQGRPGAKYPEPIIEGRPGSTTYPGVGEPGWPPETRRPGEYGRTHGELGGPPGTLNGFGQNGGRPGQVPVGPGIPGPITGGPGQVIQRPGPIIGGPGQVIGGPGQIIGRPGEIIGRPGEIIGRPGEVIGRPGEVIGSPGEVIGRPGEIIGRPGEIIGRPGETVGGPGQVIGGPGQVISRPGQFIGRPGEIIGGPGQFIGGPGQRIGGPGQVTGGPGQFIGGTGQVTGGPGRFIGGPGQVTGGTGQVTGVPGQVVWPPGVGSIAVGPPAGPGGVGRPGPEQVPTHNGGAGVINLGEGIQGPFHHAGTFGGQLAGDYQSNLGYAGRFSGKFSGQYEGAGSPYAGYAKPGVGQIPYGQPGTGYQQQQLQPQTGHEIGYQPGYNGQTRVQGPPVYNGATYGAGYPGFTDQTRPTYVGQGPYQIPGGPEGVRAEQVDLSRTGYQPGGEVYQPGGPGIGAGPTQYGGEGVTGQYGNGYQDRRITPSGPDHLGYQPSPAGPNGQLGVGITGGQQRPGYETQYGVAYQPGVQGGPGYQVGGAEIPGGPSITQYTGQNGLGSHDGRGNGLYGPGGSIQYGPGVQQGGAIDQYGTDGTAGQYGVGGTPPQYTDRRYYPGQETGQALVEGTQGYDDSDSQVQTSVQQTENGTHADAQAQGIYAGGTAQSQVSGTYTGSGSFSASAGSDNGKRGAQTQVEGGSYGAKSAAQGRGGLGQTQAQVVLSSETGDTVSSAQSGGHNHGTQSQVHASGKGGMADAQANGPGSTSSQAQIGFTPYDENETDNQTTPFRGGGTAGAQGGTLSGLTQAQIQGKFRYGIRYVGGAQAGSGGAGFGRNHTIKPGPFKPVELTFYTESNEESQAHDEKQTDEIAETNRNVANSTESPSPNQSEPETEKYSSDDETKDYSTDDAYDEEDYATETEHPVTRSIITQSSKNQRQHIVLDPLEDLDITVHQSKGDFPEEGTVLQPGQTIPGTPGYKIPAGFRGTVRSISNGPKTYTIGKNSQAQSVTLSPGSGRIIYRRPIYAVSSNTHFRNGQYGYGSGYTYQPAYQPVKYLLKNGKVLPNFVSVTKSETGSKNLYTGQKTPKVYYSQSSTCGIFTNHCVYNGGKKLCFPRAKTNPDGTIMGC